MPNEVEICIQQDHEDDIFIEKLQVIKHSRHFSLEWFVYHYRPNENYFLPTQKLFIETHKTV